MKYILLLTLLTSCGGEKPVEVAKTNNPNIDVGLLFENDGCKVYRFVDNDRYHYYTNCSETMTTQTYQCGKSRCSRPVSIKNGRSYK